MYSFQLNRHLKHALAGRFSPVLSHEVPKPCPLEMVVVDVSADFAKVSAPGDDSRENERVPELAFRAPFARFRDSRGDLGSHGTKKIPDSNESLALNDEVQVVTDVGALQNAHMEALSGRAEDLGHVFSVLRAEERPRLACALAFKREV